MLARSRPNGDSKQWRLHSHTINVSIEFIVKHKKLFFGGYIEQIRKNIPEDLRGILIIVIQTIITDISGFVQWNISK